MNCRLLLMLIMFVCMVPAKAQQTEIDSVEADQTAGLHVAMDGAVAYTYYNGADPRKKTSSLNVIYAMNNLSVKGRLSVDIGKSAVVLGSVYSGNGFVFVIGDAVAQTRTLMQVDMNGNILNKVVESGIDASLLKTDNKVYITDAMPEGCIVVYENNAKDGGYTIINYNNELKVQWEKKVSGDNGNIEIVSINKFMNILMVLRKETIDAKNQKYVYSVHSFFTDNESLQSVVELKDEDKYCFPISMSVRDGMAFVSGLYYKDGKYAEGKPQGLSVYNLGPDGAIMKKFSVPMERVNQFLPDAMIVSLAQNAMLNVVDASANNIGGSTITFEVVSKELNKSKQEATIKIADMMVARFNGQDELESLQASDIAPATTIIMKGPVVQQNLLNTSIWLNRMGLFNFRFSASMNGKQYLCHYIHDSVQRREVNVIFLPTDDPRQSMGTMLLTTRIPDTAGIMKKPRKLVLDTSVPISSTLFRKYNDIHYLPNGTLLMLNFIKPRVCFAIERIVLMH